MERPYNEPKGLQGRLGLAASEQSDRHTGEIHTAPKTDIISAAKKIVQNVSMGARLEDRIGTTGPVSKSSNLRSRLGTENRSSKPLPEHLSIVNDRKRKTNDAYVIQDDNETLENDMQIVIHQDVRPAKLQYSEPIRDLTLNRFMDIGEDAPMSFATNLNRHSLRPLDLYDRSNNRFVNRNALDPRGMSNDSQLGLSSSRGFQERDSFGPVRGFEMPLSRDELLLQQMQEERALLSRMQHTRELPMDIGGRSSQMNYGRGGYMRRGLMDDDLLSRQAQSRHAILAPPITSAAALEMERFKAQQFAAREELQMREELERERRKREALEEKLRMQEAKMRMQQQTRVDVGRQPTKFGSILESKRNVAAPVALKPTTAPSKVISTKPSANIASRLGPPAKKVETVVQKEVPNVVKKIPKINAVPMFRQEIDSDLQKHVVQLTPRQHADYNMRVLEFVQACTELSMNERFSNIVAVI